MEECYDEIYKIIKVRNLKSTGECLSLGKQGENKAKGYIFDFCCWKEKYGNGDIILYVKRPENDSAYPVDLITDGNTAKWDISDTDTGVAGKGEIELIYFVDDKIVKSLTWKTVVYPSVSYTEIEPPDPYKPWVERITEIGIEAKHDAEIAEESAIAATQAADNAAEASAHYPKIRYEDKHWLVWDVSEGKYIDTGVVAAGGGGSKHPYISLEREDAYLYKVTFDTIPIENSIATSYGGACTSYVYDGKLYRNLDWGYSETASFHVVCKDFEGMAFLDSLTDGNLSDNLIGQLPYHVCDGRNNYGIRISTHVLYNDWQWQGTGDIPLTKIPYLVLSQIQSLENFAEQMSEMLENVYAPNTLVGMDYLLQYLVTDGTTTYAILPPTSESGAYQVVDITANPKLTNFRWVEDEIVDRANLQTRPTGVERWNAIPPESLEELRFTKAYESPERLSEFIGIRGTTKDSTDAELMAIYEESHDLYEERARDGSTWQTMHSIVYSANRIDHLYVQENFEKDYIYGSGGGTGNYPELENKPLINDVELVGNKTLNDLGIQPEISDLDEIRDGALSGTTALQPDDLGSYTEDEIYDMWDEVMYSE